MMDIYIVAQRLDGVEYGKEEDEELFAEMKELGLVAVFGASDDLMEFRGAIYDEIDAWEGATAYITPDGLLENECENDGCPYHSKLIKQAVTIEGRWNHEENISWDYKTEIPHAVFNIMEGKEVYCKGIVFCLSDVPQCGQAGTRNSC